MSVVVKTHYDKMKTLSWIFLVGSDCAEVFCRKVVYSGCVCFVQEMVVKNVRDRLHWQLAWTRYAVKNKNRLAYHGFYLFTSQ